MADVINTLFVLIKKDAIESFSTSISIDQIFDKSHSRCNDVASTRNSIVSTSLLAARCGLCGLNFVTTNFLSLRTSLEISGSSINMDISRKCFFVF